ncbi:hypothetical protein AGMMS49938_15790 [Fibrobacterales bacterium]|nr:hypothetical protein AGMMS49938_15790 [Fibrobacterales bacterium]
MKIYSYYGFNDFVVLTGYKSHVIKEFFLNYYARYSDITIDMQANAVQMHRHRTEPWKVTMLYTSADTQTGARLYKAKDFLGNEPFMLTYGDGVANVNIPKLLDFHRQSKKWLPSQQCSPKGVMAFYHLTIKAECSLFTKSLPTVRGLAEDFL